MYLIPCNIHNVSKERTERTIITSPPQFSVMNLKTCAGDNTFIHLGSTFQQLVCYFCQNTDVLFWNKALYTYKMSAWKEFQFIKENVLKVPNFLFSKREAVTTGLVSNNILGTTQFQFCYSSIVDTTEVLSFHFCHHKRKMAKRFQENKLSRYSKSLCVSADSAFPLHKRNRWLL